MKQKDNCITGIKIAYIGGGSRGWAWKLMSDLAREEQLSGVVSLYDINSEAARTNETIGNRLSNRPDVKSKWKYEAADTLKSALTGADFAVISIVPGTFSEMVSDVHTPEKFGIYQSVGDTVGPGGLVRALRTIPIYAEFAEAIKSYCPQAWVINYTNPMTLCTRTLYKVFPQIKAFGCCHEVFGTQKLLAKAVEEKLGVKDIQREEIKVNVLGINHFTWIDRASWKGTDIYPLYKEFALKYKEAGYNRKKKKDDEIDYFTDNSKVKFDLFLKYGLIAAAGDRHLAEFVPPWYLKNPERVNEWGFCLTPVSYRIENMKELIEKSRRLATGQEEIEFVSSGEEGVRQIKALAGLEDLITNVNLPNKGQMTDIPYDCVVETNALFSKDSIKPVIAGRLPDDVHNLAIRHVYNQETILKAALSKDKGLAFRAFVNDPLVAIDIKDAAVLFDEMLKNTEKYLPGWNI